MDSTIQWGSFFGMTLLISVSAFIIIVGAWKMYRGFYPGSRLYEESLPTPNDLDAKTARFIMFYANWCPHSRDVKPKWDSLKKVIDDTKEKFGNRSVSIERVDCEAHQAKCSRYRVDSYPTYKLETNEKVYEYQGAPNVTLWKTFLKAALDQGKTA